MMTDDAKAFVVDWDTHLVHMGYPVSDDGKQVDTFCGQSLYVHPPSPSIHGYSMCQTCVLEERNG